MNYTINCDIKTCSDIAVYKIASVWSDGLTQELKEYALCCEQHAGECLIEACRRHAACPLEPGEILEAPCVYELQPGRRDGQLARRVKLDV